MNQRKLARQKRRHSELRPFDCGDQDGLAALLPRAVRLPAFFEENLLDEERTVRVLPLCPHAHERIFYFQLLKLIFETQHTDYELYLAKIYDILDNPRLRLLRPRPPHPCHLALPPSRVNKLLDQFLQLLGEGQVSVTEALSRFPVVDRAWVALMRTVLVLGGVCRSFEERVSDWEVYRCLGEYFEVSVSETGGCVRFDQVDVFAYSEGGAVYVAYLSPVSSEEEIISSSDFYQCEPQEAFNISSVRQMVSEIDLPLEDCFSLTRHNQSVTQTEYLDFDYSRSEEKQRVSQNETSDLRLSCLQEDSQFSLLRSNKVLEKELMAERERKALSPITRDFYAITEVPDVENALSPVTTPREARFISFGKEESLFQKENIYRRRPNREDCQMASTGESAFLNNWDQLRKETENLLIEQPLLESKQHATLKSLYDMRSIKSISCAESDSYVLPDTPLRSPPLRSPHPLRSPTGTPNMSSEFTSSFVLQQMPQQYQESIKMIKGRARKHRPNVKKLILF